MGHAVNSHAQLELSQWNPQNHLSPVNRSGVNFVIHGMGKMNSNSSSVLYRTQDQALDLPKIT